MMESVFPSKREHRDIVLKSKRKKFGRSVLCVTTSPCGKYVVGGLSDGSVHVFDLADVLRRRREKEEDDVYGSATCIDSQMGCVYDLLFEKSTDQSDTRLFAACDQGVVIWNMRSKKKKKTKKRKNDDRDDLAFSVWMRLQVPRSSLGNRGAMGPITECNKIVARGGMMYVATGDRRAFVFDLTKEKETERSRPVAVFKGHSEYLHTVSVADRLDRIFTGSEDGSVRVWNVKDETCVKVIDTANRGEKSWISATDVDADQNWLVVAGGIFSESRTSAAGHILLLHIPTLVVVKRWETTAGPLTSATFMRNKNVITSGVDGTVSVWNCLDCADTNTGPSRTFKARSSKSLYSACLNEQAGILAVSGSSPFIDVYPGVRSSGCAFSLACASSEDF